MSFGSIVPQCAPVTGRRLPVIHLSRDEARKSTLCVARLYLEVVGWRDLDCENEEDKPRKSGNSASSTLAQRRCPVPKSVHHNLYRTSPPSITAVNAAREDRLNISTSRSSSLPVCEVWGIRNWVRCLQP